jgi:hypothetical protein
MTNTSTEANRTTAELAAPTDAPRRPRPRRWILAGAGLVVVIVVAVVVPMALTGDDAESGDWQTADVGAQGAAEPVLASDGARLLRRADGLSAEIEVPTPEPGSYEYPTADMVQEWAEPHPPVSPGASDASEVFTVWVIVFNDPSLCVSEECGAEDLGADTAARGGVYQLDGRIADGDTLRFSGNIRLGQPPLFGSPLDDPLRALVHLPIAPHGRALPGEEGWRQLNGPVGNPDLWWGASFFSP